MTGGGFGGCVVVLTSEEEVKTTKAQLSTRLAGTGFGLFEAHPSAGARVVDATIAETE